MFESLPRRERQLVEALFGLGEATAAEIRDAVEAPPSYSAVRAMLARLEAKGAIAHREDGQRYVYRPLIKPAKARESALRQVVRAFFDNSPASAATALLGMTERLDATELAALEAAVRKAKENIRE